MDLFSILIHTFLFRIMFITNKILMQLFKCVRLKLGSEWGERPIYCSEELMCVLVLKQFEIQFHPHSCNWTSIFVMKILNHVPCLFWMWIRLMLMSLREFCCFSCFHPGKEDVIHCSSPRIFDVMQQYCFSCSYLFLFPPSFFVCRYFLFCFSLCLLPSLFSSNCFLLCPCRILARVCEICATVFI